MDQQRKNVILEKLAGLSRAILKQLQPGAYKAMRGGLPGRGLATAAAGSPELPLSARSAFKEMRSAAPRDVNKVEAYMMGRGVAHETSAVRRLTAGGESAYVEMDRARKGLAHGRRLGTQRERLREFAASMRKWSPTQQ